MLTRWIIFFTMMLLLTLSLLACNGLAAPTHTGSSDSAEQAIEVVTFTEQPTAAPIEPAVTPVTVADTQAVSLNAPAETSVLPPTPAPTAPKTLAVSPVISAEPAALTPKLIARPRNAMNIRQGPGTVYSVIGSAGGGQSFTITGRNEDASWLQISSEAIPQGWLYANLVEISGDMQAVPLIQADNIPRSPAADTEEVQPAVSTAEALEGTIYFALATPPEDIGYFDPVTGQSGSINLDGVKAGGIYKISPDGMNLTPVNSIVPDGGIDLSPDGQKVAFTVQNELVGGMFGTYFDNDIYVMNIDGTGLANLTNSPDLSESGVRWLPDGQWLIYLQSYDSAKRLPSEDNFSDIYVFDINQTTSLNLTHHSPGRIVYRYTVSPNGQQVVFISEPAPGIGQPPPPGMDFVPDRPETLSVVNLDGSGRLDLIDNPSGYEIRQLAWSPDSQRIALTVGVQQEDGGYIHDIHLINPDGTQHVNITKTADAFESEPVWSPDGQQLAVSCNYSQGGVYSKNEMTGIQFFGRDGTAQIACIDLPDTYAAEDIKWSPDGQRVAIFSERILVEGKLLSSPQTTLFTIKADGTDLTQITASDLDAGYGFIWSPAQNSGNRRVCFR
jgi:Tol biopolymer transport system component